MKVESPATERCSLGVAEGLVTRPRVPDESIGADRVSRRRDVARRSLRLRRGTELGRRIEAGSDAVGPGSGIPGRAEHLVTRELSAREPRLPICECRCKPNNSFHVYRRTSPSAG